MPVFTEQSARERWQNICKPSSFFVHLVKHMCIWILVDSVTIWAGPHEKASYLLHEWTSTAQGSLPTCELPEPSLFAHKIYMELEEFLLLIYIWNVSNLIPYLGHVMRKRVLCHMQTTKVQISLRVRAVAFIRINTSTSKSWFKLAIHPFSGDMAQFSSLVFSVKHAATADEPTERRWSPAADSRSRSRSTTTTASAATPDGATETTEREGIVTSTTGGAESPGERGHCKWSLSRTVKSEKIRTSAKIAVIVLKFEFTIE